MPPRENLGFVLDPFILGSLIELGVSDGVGQGMSDQPWGSYWTIASILHFWHLMATPEAEPN